MRTRAKGTSRAAVLAAGFVALGVTAIPSNAFADVTSGNGGVLSGNQIDAPIAAPVDVSGNAVAVLGTGDATSHGGVTIHKRGQSGQKTSGTHGIASGNQVNAPISIPVDVCGNAVAIAGDAVAGCEGGSVVKHAGNTGAGRQASGIFGIGSGNQGNLPISAPVDLCGNAVGSGTASCAGGASVHDGGHGTDQTTEGAFGIITGDQVNAPISLPVTVCGNAAGVVGEAWAFCEGGAHAHGDGTGGDQHASGTGGVITGTQGNAPISIPVEVCGNGAAIVGTASGLCEDVPGYGGYDGYYRTAGTQLPQAVPGAATDLPATDTALPQNTLPQLDGVSTAGDLAQVGGLTNLLAAQPVNGRTAHGDLTTTDGITSATDDVVANNALPGSGALSTVQGLAATDDLVRTGGLSTLAGLPMAGHRAQAGLPGTDDVVAPNTLPKLDATSALNGRRVPADLSAAHGILPANGLSKGLALNNLSTAHGTDGLLPTAALPTTTPPGLNAQRTRDGLPDTDGLIPAGTLPKLDGVSAVSGQRAKSSLPSTDGLVAANTVPGLDGVSALDVHDGLPGTNGLLPAGTVPGLDGVSAVSGQRAKGGLPGADGLVSGNTLSKLGGVSALSGGLPGTGGLVPAGSRGAARQGGAPVAVSVLDTRALPGGGVVRRPIGLRAVDALRSPRHVVVPATPATGHEVVPATGEIGPVRNVAAKETVSDGAGSLWAFAASGFLGVLAGALTLARRVRLDGRR
ncbi:chaplin family protein [Actinomadura chokoriensis]|uniref:chaplin family protein n=1 Tax=Actinomadura chokoriensis TaxID=454156 RepID=UPI0031F7CA6E